MEPREVKMTCRRRVVYDHPDGEWRVVYYGPSVVGEHVRKLDRRERAGSDAAKRELDAIEEVRLPRKSADLRSALDYVLFTKATPNEIDEVCRYILARALEPAA